MRTKALLLSAALVAAGVASSMAQSSNVYSLNIVGYVNTTVQSNTFYLIGNPLDDGKGDVITNVLNLNDTFDQSSVFTFSGGSLTPVETYFAGFGWFPGTNTLVPGQGFYFFATTNSTVTFVGSVTLASTNPLPAGFSLVSSAYPASLPLSSLGLTGQDQDAVFRFTPTGPNKGLSDISTFFAGYGWFETGPTAPGDGGSTNGVALGVGEGFFYDNTHTAISWTQSFTVN